MRPLSFRRSYLLLAAAAVLMFPALAVACSGPGAPAAIFHAERMGWILWIATLVLAGGSALMPRMRARGRRNRWPMFLLAVLHPGWWMSARSGDCGQSLLEGSYVFTALTVLVAAFLVWRSRRAA
ncbi:hypothetical protein [Nannocystis radixulma]|uniref:Lipoprotein n=1 Tax=Nannocystis radixulma TaxID=2995305 RepID=A0ABT5BDZ1_9BACT|nr:hypothetical protein [Nannocystis radixulma]MDC0672282.1 hypothetical protein [Nannocystis radixulma]